MQKENLKNKIREASEKVRATNPLAPSITNTVTINFVANAQLAVGGSAAMFYLPDEGETGAQIGGAFYINAGTFFPVYKETLPATAKKLHELNKPWVLDPVTLGIGSLRTEMIMAFKDFPPAIVRGNASEIITVAKLWGLLSDTNAKGAKGVESSDSVESAKEAAKILAKFIKGAVAVSGKEDLVTDGETVVFSKGGSPFMEKITGAGCSLGGVCAVYAAVTDPFTAALAATQHYNIAGTRAHKKSKAPGTFQVKFIDELYLATPKDIANNPFEIV
nr:hydroxyethylthiazole kinase [uncultured Treponema sp.]